MTCYTCHQRQTGPERHLVRSGPVAESDGGLVANQNMVTVSEYTSLPSSALMAYLVEGEPINVHSSRAASRVCRARMATPRSRRPSGPIR